MRKKILAVASGGGHWVQLMRIRPAFNGHEVVYATVQKSYSSDVHGERFYQVNDATRWSRWSLIKMIMQVAWIVVKERPKVVISTGAAPGVVALRMGKFVGAHTIWLDSVANVEAISMSGEKVKGFADLRLTQWESLASNDGPEFHGAVL